MKKPKKIEKCACLVPCSCGREEYNQGLEDMEAYYKDRDLSVDEIIRTIAFCEAKKICRSLLNGHERIKIAKAIITARNRKRDKVMKEKND